MGEKTSIAWTHHTWNPWRGCAKVSPGCAHCYAEALSRRNPAVLGEWGPNGTRIVAAESAWRQPLKWDRAARLAGERRRVFCASMADVFEDRPELVAPRARLFHLIQETQYLDWLLLTKRPENVATHLARATNAAYGVPQTHSAHAAWLEGWLTGQVVPRNVWLGVSVEDQQRAEERIPLLLRTPAAVRFVSAEPLLGPVDLMAIKMGCGWRALDCACSAPGCDHETLDWVIVGGESGPGARPCCLDWVRSLVRQCREANVACFVKQLGACVRTVLRDENNPGYRGYMDSHYRDRKGGSPEEWPEDLRVRQWPEVRR